MTGSLRICVELNDLQKGRFRGGFCLRNPVLYPLSYRRDDSDSSRSAGLSFRHRDAVRLHYSTVRALMAGFMGARLSGASRIARSKRREAVTPCSKSGSPDYGEG